MIEERDVIKRLLLHEGAVNHVYKCPAGYLTIGVGRNLETNPLTPKEKRLSAIYQKGLRSIRRSIY